MTPADTEKMTRATIQHMKDAGLVRLAVSLDGHNKESHDKFRGVEGSFKWTMDSIRFAREIGLEVQMNTTVTRFNKHRAHDMAAILAKENPTLWSVFFLVPVGRGGRHLRISPKEHEEIFHESYDLNREMPFDIKTTAAQYYRWVMIPRAAMDRIEGVHQNGNRNNSIASSLGFNAAGSGNGSAHTVAGRSTKGVSDGRGFVFISHLGDVIPSGFLPVSASNVRNASLVDTYRDHEMFRALRRPKGYENKCGYCDYNDVYDGSRSRA
jgi:MoaA/NifB/PqqE/SkfB family radical SAM enzyme